MFQYKVFRTDVTQTIRNILDSRYVDPSSLAFSAVQLETTMATNHVMLRALPVSPIRQ